MADDTVTIELQREDAAVLAGMIAAFLWKQPTSDAHDWGRRRLMAFHDKLIGAVGMQREPGLFGEPKEP